MTNFELNKAIAELVYPDSVKLFKIGDRVRFSTIDDKYGRRGYTKDYCNNWNDLMPLVVEHNVEYYAQQLRGNK